MHPFFESQKSSLRMRVEPGSTGGFTGRGALMGAAGVSKGRIRCDSGGLAGRGPPSGSEAGGADCCAELASLDRASMPSAIVVLDPPS
eukprot:CAMPEP_0185206962 /NCGR_PEP_ID=MMETSP1140-20130426/59426_1 /TAXON_ID=298111 /ORGANISM="Pavlova sp., Strain CCMP459" /LENGTH=87 /DNA_ID=CAMNT_0027774631 /DNA_START=895 /DNA_END=1154 /DNA_ORIENTATION=-